MTTPEGPVTGSEASNASATPRATRPQPQRTGPIRSQSVWEAPVPDPAPGPGTAGAPDNAAGAPVSESVARAVKMGYDVIAENIRQGRIAAERFREGEYNIREVPGDLEVAALRLLKLARELSTTTFDVCEKLLKEIAANAPAKARTAGVPPFPAPSPDPPPSTTKAADPRMMRLTVRFEGGPPAQGHTTHLERPSEPTAPSDITADPLAARDAGLSPITSVRFDVDMALEGLVAIVQLPQNQAAGIYSGLVHTPHSKVPLGVLTIEVGK